MCDQHRHLLAVELLPLRIDHPQGSSVDIAVNPAQGLERGNRIGRFDVPKLGVPNFIDFGQNLRNGASKVPCVSESSPDLFHSGIATACFGLSERTKTGLNRPSGKQFFIPPDRSGK